ncbi:MAG: phosphodiester glycosidase family protein, partial [Myxococcales bacterium]|nr:phosphodiester glycosidase family protein [Myxococcales bacterium]
VDQPGTYYVAVDTWESASRAGPYAVMIDFVPVDAWRATTIARGVTLRRRIDSNLYGGRQTETVLDLDLTEPSLSLRVLEPSTCLDTTSEMGRAAGAVAAVNGGFFDTGGCESVSLVVIDGELIATNVATRSAFGIDEHGDPMIDLVAAGEDWPEADHAVGGLPRLVAGGLAAVQTESGLNASFAGRNPRTAVGITEQGNVMLAAFDGRTTAGAGLSLDELAERMVEHGAFEAVNLDGGGSTEMWIGEPMGWIANHPSDASGERRVFSAIGVFADPIERDPVWLTEPGPIMSVREGETWSYAAAIADAKGRIATFELVHYLDGRVQLEDHGDGTALISVTPIWPDGYPEQPLLSLEATTELGTVAQSINLTVVLTDDDNDGMADSWESQHGLSVGLDDADADLDGDGASNFVEFVVGTNPAVSDLASSEDMGEDVGSIERDAVEASDWTADSIGQDRESEPWDDAFEQSADVDENQSLSASEVALAQGCGCSISRPLADVSILWAIGFLVWTGRRQRPCSKLGDSEGDAGS